MRIIQRVNCKQSVPVKVGPLHFHTQAWPRTKPDVQMSVFCSFCGLWSSTLFLWFRTWDCDGSGTKKYRAPESLYVSKIKCCCCGLWTWISVGSLEVLLGQSGIGFWLTLFVQFCSIVSGYERSVFDFLCRGDQVPNSCSQRDLFTIQGFIRDARAYFWSFVLKDENL